MTITDINLGWATEAGTQNPKLWGLVSQLLKEDRRLQQSAVNPVALIHFQAGEGE
jgi:hypothetical protein